jgi:Protein of unknown function (DUF2877)
VRAVSVSSAVLPYLYGPTVAGVSLGQGYIDFAGHVLAVTRPGAPRMPNGIETSVVPERGGHARIGEGVLRIESEVVEPGAVWNPVPSVRVMPRALAPARRDLESLAGRGPGLTPAGDDVLAGYAAGLTLFCGRREEASGIARRAWALTTGLSATLIEHASRGQLPEPVHAYLESGDSSALDRFGHSSGRCLRLGLMIAAGAQPGGG